MIALLVLQIWELALYELATFAVVQMHHANIALPARLDRALRLVIVTPFMHKVHHSRWQPETDSNYSSLFSFWDRLFARFDCVRIAGLCAMGWRNLTNLDITLWSDSSRHQSSR